MEQVVSKGKKEDFLALSLTANITLAKIQEIEENTREFMKKYYAELNQEIPKPDFTELVFKADRVLNTLEEFKNDDLVKDFTSGWQVKPLWNMYERADWNCTFMRAYIFGKDIYTWYLTKEGMSFIRQESISGVLSNSGLRQVEPFLDGFKVKKLSENRVYSKDLKHRPSLIASRMTFIDSHETLPRSK